MTPENRKFLVASVIGSSKELPSNWSCPLEVCGYIYNRFKCCLLCNHIVLIVYRSAGIGQCETVCIKNWPHLHRQAIVTFMFRKLKIFFGCSTPIALFPFKLLVLENKLKFWAEQVSMCSMIQRLAGKFVYCLYILRQKISYSELHWLDSCTHCEQRPQE